MAAYYRRGPAVASRVVDGEAVVIRMPEAVLHVLNPAATRAWLAADGAATLEEISARLDCAPEAVERFLDDMVARGLMSSSAEPLERPESFPQELAPLEVPPGQAPAIRATEKLEAVAGVCTDTFATESLCPSQWS
jgi:hypothetical protein